jgi:hypothetical protein
MTPEQKALIDDFVSESEAILAELENIIDELADGDREVDDFALVGQRIDGIMGCAKTMGLVEQQELAWGKVPEMLGGGRILHVAGSARERARVRPPASE